MPRMNGKPTLGEAIRRALNEDPQPLRIIHQVRLNVMGQGDQYPSGSGATQACLAHMVTRGEVIEETIRNVRHYRLAERPPYEASDEAPCRAVIRFYRGTKGRIDGEAMCCFADTHTVHEAASPMHMPDTGVIVRWRGSDEVIDEGYIGVHHVYFMDAVTGQFVGQDDPRRRFTTI